MARKLFDAAVPCGEYTDRNGITKAKWETVGSVIETDNGKRGLLLKRTFNPAGLPVDDKSPYTAFISLFEPKAF